MTAIGPSSITQPVSATALANPDLSSSDFACHSSVRSIPLPIELLREIFLFASDADFVGDSEDCSFWWDEPEEPSASGVQPLCIAAVCRTWRHVALDTPRLWTQISVGVRRGSTKLSMDPCVVRTMLERSGSMPLDIFVNLHDAEMEDVLELWDDIFAQLLDVSARWRVLSLHEPLPVQSSAFDAFCAATAPCLEHLHLDVYRLLVYSAPSKVEERRLLLDCPRLRCLRLHNFPGDSIRLALMLSTYQFLTRINFEESELEPGTLWGILSAVPGLEYLGLSDLTLSDRHPSAPTSLNRVCLPNLTKLELDNYYKRTYIMQRCAPFLDLPRLEYISRSHHDTEEFQALVPRVLHSLTRLRIGLGSEGFDKALLPELAALTHVREFTWAQLERGLDHDVPPPVLFDMMRDGEIFPKLETLSFCHLFLVWGDEAAIESANAHWSLWCERDRGSPPEEVEASASALLDFVTARNRPTDYNPSAKTYPRLRVIRFVGSALEAEYRKKLEALVPVELR
ncbi:hypothetical protein AURDEDRAFT_171698 [Auricularia subglabra TFB-10046 SS5]|nr:hypothetical protein AURDEDRAFT_171698 [Auricularia subglabra TFB-10046 SS5]